MTVGFSTASRGVLIVDDNTAAREGRRAWLENAGLPEVVDLDFRDALTYTAEQWQRLAVLVVDGFDERSDTERRRGSAGLDWDQAMLAFDRYMGVQVVRAARLAHPTLRVIVVSNFVDDSPALVERFYQAARDCFIYPASSVNHPADFVDAVKAPDGETKAGSSKRNDRMLELNLDRAARVDRALDLLAGQNADRYGLSPNQVAAANAYLLGNQTARQIQDQFGVSRRELDAAVDQVRKFLPGADDSLRESKPRTELLRGRVVRLLGWEHKWTGKNKDDFGQVGRP